MRCPYCRKKVLQKAGDVIRLRSDGPVEFTLDGKCMTKCYWCKSKIEIPLQIHSGTQVEGERFILPAGSTS